MRIRFVRLALGMLLTVGLAAPAWSQTTQTKKADVAKSKSAPTSKKVVKVDLNKSSLEEIQELPGIGPVRAAEIVKLRPIKSIDDLKAIRGMTPRALAELSPHVIATAPEPAKKAATKPAMTKETVAAKAAARKAAIAKEDDPSHASRKKAALGAGEKIDLNTASIEELEKLPYIGPTRSAAIVKARPFATIEGVMKVDGVKEGIFSHIKDHIIVK